MQTTIGVILRRRNFGGVRRTSDNGRIVSLLHRRSPSLLILSLIVPSLGNLSILRQVGANRLSYQILAFSSLSPRRFRRHYVHTNTLTCISGAGSLDRLRGTIRTIVTNCACFTQLPSTSLGGIRRDRTCVVSSLSGHRLAVYRRLTHKLDGGTVTRIVRLDRGAIDACGAQLVSGLQIDSTIRLHRFTGHGRLV